LVCSGDTVIVDVNPFVYSRPVSPEEIIDRDGETAALLRHAVGGHFVRLYAPRKYGKTTLLKRALADGERSEGLIPVLVDLYRVGSLADVTIRIERAYARHLRGSLRDRIEAFLQRTGLGLSLGAYGIGARIQTTPSTDPLAALHALLDLPLRLDESDGFRALIAFDEFQDVGRIDGLDGLLRSHIQHQGDVASYVFAGSEPGLMRRLFETRGRPLYESAVPLRLGRLVAADIAAHVADRFVATGRGVGEALGPLLESAQGHPQRAILLAHHLWERVPNGSAAGLDTWRETHDAAMGELDSEFDAQWRRIQASEQKTLRSIVAGGGSPYRQAILDRLQLEKPTAQSAVRRLLDSADVEADGKRYRVVDPLFAEWIRRIETGV
jgi:hypothetical protein